MLIRLTALLMSAVLVPAAFAQPLDGPLPPEQVLKSFKVEPGLKLELVAAEPLVVSPCAVCWDERGRMFVAENRGYPTGPKEGEPPQGRVTQLIDKDGDGRMDERVDFATELSFPNGLMPWRGGLIVTCSPDVLFLKDTDGDGKADEKKVLLTGFSTKGSTQLRVSHPMLALDGWVYLTSGLTGGEVISPLKPDQAPVKVGRTDIRFKPDTGEIEPCDGGAQFGQTFDDFGRRFICYNRVQVQHVVLESKYLKRNPHLAFAETVENCPAEMADEPLKGHGKAARLFPISSNVTTADSHAGTFTAACAVTIYRGTSLPSDYYGTVFSCDPTGNLVHVDKLVPHGATFRAHRMHADREVLASTDNWFRPVFLANAPDGALYVCDMYRQTIEHPDYLPVEIRKRTDFSGGKTMGRIYRLRGEAAPQLPAQSPSDSTTKVATPISGDQRVESEQLCQWLKHRDGWSRDTAQRLLQERLTDDASAIPELSKLLKQSDLAAPTLAAAARLLRQRQLLDKATLMKLFEHPVGGVREQAVIVADEHFSQLPILVGDVDPAVAFRATLRLGDLRSGAINLRIAALAFAAMRDGDDRWMRAAVLSSTGRPADVFVSFQRQAATGKSMFNTAVQLDASMQPRFQTQLNEATRQGALAFCYDFGRVWGASCKSQEIRWQDVLHQVTKPGSNTMNFEQTASLVSGIGDALRSSGQSFKGQSVLVSVFEDANEGTDRELRNQLEQLFKTASDSLRDRRQAESRRVIAINLLKHAPAMIAADALVALIQPDEPQSVQLAVINTLAGLHQEDLAAKLLTRERFMSYSPRLREELLGALVTAPQHVPGLLTAIEAGVVPPAAIDTLRRRQLTQHKDPAVKERAGKIFGAGPSGDRAKVYEEHKSVLTLTPNAENGRAVFKRACSSCHRLDREGTPVGPDLFGIRNQPKEAILLHILVPEHEITPGFTAYIVTTKEGRVLTGLISSETATSITLKQALGKEETILRQDIEELASSNLSLMPQGVEKTVNQQEFADLLSYLKGEK